MAEKNNGYFPFPNEIIDKLLPLLTGAEFKVLSVIIRQTVGWRKHWDRIALSQFSKKTGLSKPGVINSLEVLLSNNLIICDKIVGEGRLPENWYALFGDTNEADKLVKSVDQYSELTSKLILSEMVKSVDQLGEKLVNSVDTQKTRSKNNTKNNTKSQEELLKKVFLKKDIDNVTNIKAAMQTRWGIFSVSDASVNDMLKSIIVVKAHKGQNPETHEDKWTDPEYAPLQFWFDMMNRMDKPENGINSIGDYGAKAWEDWAKKKNIRIY